ncbi:MAG: FAD-dependent oxidoreductase [Streptomycetales bacterium]
MSTGVGTHELRCDVLVVGGGLGGVAAALSAARLGRRVVLAEPTSWLGGQLTSQGVPPDEHPWIEHTGATVSYRRLRAAIREQYRRQGGLTARARRDRYLNPGGGWVSALCHEPRVAARVLRERLADHERRGLVRVLLCQEAAEAQADRDRVEGVVLRDRASGTRRVVTAPYVLDATEEGDLLSLAGCEHTVGAESQDSTGEPHALPGAPNAHDQQAITWCFAVEHRPGEDHTIDRPTDYGFWRDYRPPHWPGALFGWETPDPETSATLRRPLFATAGEQDLWTFRRLRRGANFREGGDISLVNWPQVDYWLGPVVGVPGPLRRAHLEGARGLGRSFLYWLQTEAPRPDGGTGYPGLRPHGDALGTPDGFAMRPYIRESRRIHAEFTVLETHVGVEARPGRGGAELFDDSVGVGSYRIDLHPSTSGRPYVDVASWPFQIPLGALLPVRMRNLLPAAKNLGVTHVTNGCFRLHPVEWNVGEAAGALAAFCLERGAVPHAVRERAGLLAEFQHLLEDRLGVGLRWPAAVRGCRR